MPIYRYVCTECGADESVTHKINEDPPKRLETCVCESDNPKPARVPARTAFTLKGNGWYKDGY